MTAMDFSRTRTSPDSDFDNASEIRIELAGCLQSAFRLFSGCFRGGEGLPSDGAGNLLFVRTDWLKESISRNLQPATSYIMISGRSPSHSSSSHPLTSSS